MATGDTLVFTALNNELAATNPATLDTRGDHPVLDFDDTTNEDALFSAVMPATYRRGGLSVSLHHAMSTATSGDVDWKVAFERIGDRRQDLDAAGFASAKTAADNPVPPNCGNVATVDLTFGDGAELDYIAPGDGFRVKITRDAQNDTASGDAELLFVTLKES